MPNQLRLGWQQIPHSFVTEILSSIFDGVVLDMEHSLWPIETLTSSIQVATLMKKQCLVRIHKRDLGMVSKLLDTGATGIMLSTVETAEEARRFSDLARHYIDGGTRGLGLVRENMWGEKGLVTPKPILVPQIESISAINNLKKIKRPEFDYYLIGPYDLSASLSCDGDFENHKFKEAIQKFNNLVSPSERAVHIPKDVPEHIYNYCDVGMISVGMDTSSIIESSKANLNAAKNLHIHTD